MSICMLKNKNSVYKIKIESIPIAETFLKLKGTISNLENAVASKDESLVFERQLELLNMIKFSYEAINNSNKNSLAHKTLCRKINAIIRLSFSLIHQTSECFPGRLLPL